jgi:hypothetical protein
VEVIRLLGMIPKGAPGEGPCKAVAARLDRATRGRTSFDVGLTFPMWRVEDSGLAS